PINIFDRHCTGFRDFRSLAEEVLHFKPAVAQQHTYETVSPRPVKSGILFSFKAPDVRSLKLVGDFNNWTPDGSADLERREDGTWHKVLPLSPGKYHYKFIVDGEWKEDPANPKVSVNDFGGVDSVIEVKPFEFPELMQQAEQSRAGEQGDT
ncbi:MAG: glycogen-binding domain-containing protein, partial [bacterium]|nr:glycogen-binding domain-containing protein [bacterium]